MGALSLSSITKKVIWLDENINNEENQLLFNKLQKIFINSKGFQLLDEGFETFYKKNTKGFKIIFVIVSGKLFGKYVQKIKENINKIINIPYTYIFTSNNFKQILLDQLIDKEHILSYDTKIAVNNGFYNPGGVYDSFDELLGVMKKMSKKIDSIIKIKPRIKEKMNYEGVLTFEYLESEEDLLAPALYKDIITNEAISEEDCIKFHQYILSFKEKELDNLIKNFDFFKFVPYEILSKYWARCYTIESDFYKILNNNLMKSKLSFVFKTFIKMLYTGVEINSLQSFKGQYLYRGSVINKVEIEKINSYKKSGKLSNIVVFGKAFLSFSENKDKALKFCGKSDDSKVGILYVLENYNNNLHESNADIQSISVFPDEKEILFFPGSSFIIKDLKTFDENKIEITLNYNGKFKEKYSFLYDNTTKLNNLINNNIITKNIAGKQLEFLKGGKYLKGEKIDELGTTFKGKNLETDEIISIKQIPKNNMPIFKFNYLFLDPIRQISNRIKNSVKYKEHFETEDYYYIIQNSYDDNLEHYLEINKRLNPNLIHKIFTQLNITFKDLLNNSMFIIVRPSNILIKYCNPEKTNFDSFLSDYKFSSEEYEENEKYPVPGNCNMIPSPKFNLFACQMCVSNTVMSNMAISNQNFDYGMMNCNMMMSNKPMMRSNLPNQNFDCGMMNCNMMMSNKPMMRSNLPNQNFDYGMTGCNMMMSNLPMMMSNIPNQNYDYGMMNCNMMMSNIPNQNYDYGMMNCNMMTPNTNFGFNNMMMPDRFLTYYDSYLYNIGITIYVLYFGKLPFSSYSVNEFNNLLKAPKTINVIIEEDRKLEDLLNKILKENEFERISWEQYFNHPFFKQYIY